MPFGTGVSPNGGTCTAPNAHPPAQESITPESCPYLGFGEEATHCASCKELQGLKSTQGPSRLSAEMASHWVLMFHPTGMLEPPPMELHLDQRLVLMGPLRPHCNYPQMSRKSVISCRSPNCIILRIWVSCPFSCFPQRDLADPSQVNTLMKSF